MGEGDVEDENALVGISHRKGRGDRNPERTEQGWEAGFGEPPATGLRSAPPWLVASLSFSLPPAGDTCSPPASTVGTQNHRIWDQRCHTSCQNLDYGL